MSFVVSCSCGQSFAADPSLAGQTLACPVCGRPIYVGISHANAPVPALAANGEIPFAHGIGGGYFPSHTGQAAGPRSTATSNSKLIVAALAGGGVALLLLVAMLGLYASRSKGTVIATPIPAATSAMAPPTSAVTGEPAIAKAPPTPLSPFSLPGVFSMSLPETFQWSNKSETVVLGVTNRQLGAVDASLNCSYHISIFDKPMGDKNDQIAYESRAKRSISRLEKEAAPGTFRIGAFEKHPTVAGRQQLQFQYTDQTGNLRTGAIVLIYGRKRTVSFFAEANDNSTRDRMLDYIDTYQEL